jgi:hypothetical protein
MDELSTRGTACDRPDRDYPQVFAKRSLICPFWTAPMLHVSTRRFGFHLE